MFDNVGESREVKQFNWWKPQVPTVLAGKLDRVEGSRRYGDRAVFSLAAIFRKADGAALACGEIAVGISGNLEGRITPADSGRWFVVEFTGFGEAAPNESAPRRFKVTLVAGERESEVADAVARAYRSGVAGSDSAPLGARDGDGDDLPF